MADTQQGRQVGVDRLKRRMDSYRSHDTVNSSHFEATVDTIYGDQRKQTHVLKQRHIESKVKKTKKSADNKKTDSSLLGNMGQSKLLARGHDQTTGPCDLQENEPAAKKQRLVNGSIVTSVAADISDFQIVQQLRNIKSNNSPNPVASNNVNQCSIVNPSSSTIPQDILEGLSDSALGVGNESDDIKKESDIDIPNDSLLEDLGELGSFEDMDMGINLADFVHDLDLDNIKHENSNPGIESYFKEEIGDTYDDPSNISSDSGLANSSSNKQLSSQLINKINSTTNVVPSYSHYSNAGTPPNSHSSTPPSYTQNSFSSLQQTSFNSISCSTNSLNNPYTMSPTLSKMRINNMTGQSDLAAQALKQMAEQHQTKLSPTSNPVRSSLGDFGYNNMTGTSMMGQSVPVSNQMYNTTLNQTNPLYNQNIGGDIEMKRRQQMMQQYSLQQMQHPQSNVGGHCNQQVSQGHSQNIQQPAQSQSTGISHAQQQKPVQQTQQQPQTQPNPQSLHQHQMQTVQHQPQVSQQQQMLPQSQHQAQVQQSNSQSPQMTNSISPFSNRMSPMSNYAHVSQTTNKIGINTPYGGNMCGAMNSGIRGAYPSQTGGSSPIPTGPQGQTPSMQNGNQSPRYMQQQMMGSVNMMRSQMINQSGQIMTRPPPPEYRHAAMMQQHQPMMNPSMSQMHQGMGQISYQNMRPTYRPNMTGNPMANMAGGQMIGTLNQQSIPANIPNMKASMVSPNMNNPVTMGQGNVGPTGSLSGNGMSVTMNQVSTGGNIGLVNARPTMMQHARPSNVNMGMSNLGMSTQMPPSRPEWRQMMMPQGQNGMMMNPNIRHGYGQAQQGSMMSQGGQMISMQRSQPHMIGMMNMQNGPSMQHNPTMNSNNAMQGNGSISASIHNNTSLQTGMTLGGRMSQHGMVMGQQGQIRMGMQINPQGMPDSHQSSNLVQNQGGVSVNINQMNSASGAMGHHGGSSVNQNISQMVGGVNMTPMNSMSSTNINPMAQVASCNGTHANPLNQNVSVGNMNPMNTHPRSPATLGQMHPCSPVASGASTSGGPSRPLSNPGLGLSSSQVQNVNCSQTSSGSSSPMMQQQCLTSQSQMRQTMGGNIVSSVRTPNTVCQVSQSHPVQGIGVLSQSSVPSQLNQSLGQCANNGMPSNTNLLINKSGNNVVSSVGSGGQRPESGGSGMKLSQPPTPNPPSNSASNDFDLIFNNEGEFAALLH